MGNMDTKGFNVSHKDTLTRGLGQTEKKQLSIMETKPPQRGSSSENDGFFPMVHQLTCGCLQNGNNLGVYSWFTYKTEINYI